MKRKRVFCYVGSVLTPAGVFHIYEVRYLLIPASAG